MENEPPNALPSLDPAPPTATLTSWAVSTAVTETEPAVDCTDAPWMYAATVLLISLSPIEALTATPALSDRASEPAPESIAEVSLALTSTGPTAWTCPAPVLVI